MKRPHHPRRTRAAAAAAHRGGRAKARAKRSHARGAGRRWVQTVTSVSTHPPAGLFTRDARTIARSMASRRVSPKGIGSGIRMIQYYINRAGSGLSISRRRELERAKKLLQDRHESQRARSRGRRGTPA